MHVDIPAYVFKRKTFLQATIAEANREQQENINRIQESVEVMQTTLTELNRKLATQEKKERESQKKRRTILKILKI